MSRGHRTSPGEASCTCLPVQFPGDIGLVKERLAVHLSIPEQCPGNIGLVQERIAVHVNCPGDIGLVKERPDVHLYLYSVQGT